MQTQSIQRFRFWPRLSVRRIADAIVQYDAQYRQRKQFAALDDRMLRDIGLTAAQRDAELRRPLQISFPMFF